MGKLQWFSEVRPSVTAEQAAENWSQIQKSVEASHSTKVLQERARCQGELRNMLFVAGEYSKAWSHAVEVASLRKSEPDGFMITLAGLAGDSKWLRNYESELVVPGFKDASRRLAQANLASIAGDTKRVEELTRTDDLTTADVPQMVPWLHYLRARSLSATQRHMEALDELEKHVLPDLKELRVDLDIMLVAILQAAVEAEAAGDSVAVRKYATLAQEGVAPFAEKYLKLIGGRAKEILDGSKGPEGLQ
jgi:hypothetical protein